MSRARMLPRASLGTDMIPRPLQWEPKTFLSPLLRCFVFSLLQNGPRRRQQDSQDKGHINMDCRLGVAGEGELTDPTDPSVPGSAWSSQYSHALFPATDDSECLLPVPSRCVEDALTNVNRATSTRRRLTCLEVEIYSSKLLCRYRALVLV